MKLTAEQIAAIEKIATEMPGFQRRLAELEPLDVKALTGLMDEVRELRTAITQRIKSWKGGFYVPGMESAKFSFLKACIAMAYRDGLSKSRFEACGAGAEFEMLKAVEKVHGEEIYRLKRFGVTGKAPQSVGNDELGGAFVPDQLIPDVIGAIYTRSVFIALASEDGDTRIGMLDGLFGGRATIPKFKGGMEAFWIDEEDDLIESTTKVDKVTLAPRKLAVLARITKEMQDLQGNGFDAMFRRDMVKAMAKKLDWTIAYGTGGGGQSGEGGMPRGIINTHGIKIFNAENGASATFTAGTNLNAGVFPGTWAGGELDFTKLDQMRLALVNDDIEIEQDASAWISSPAFFFRLKNLRVTHFSGQTTGMDYLIGPMLSDQRLRDVIGQFGWSNQIPNGYRGYATTRGRAGASLGATPTNTNAKFSDVFYSANWRDTLLGRWNGIEIEDDGGKGDLFKSDQTRIKVRSYFDVGQREPRNIIVCADARVAD